MQVNPIRTAMAVFACLIAQAVLAPAQAAPATQAALAAPPAQATVFATAQPHGSVGGLKSAGDGSSSVKPGVYCCTTQGQCTPHGLLTVCVGANYIRWECKADGKCARAPFGGDN